MLKITNNTALLKGVLIAVLFHVIIGIALVSNSGRNENLVEQRKSAAVPTHNKKTPIASVPKTHDKHQIQEGLRTSHIYSWLDSDGVKHYSDSAPPPRSRNVEIRKESEAGTQARRSSVTDVRPIYSAKAYRAKEINTASANRYYKRVLEELVINERTRLKRELEIYEQRYWRREKAIISLEEKERLMRPIAKTREKLEKLQESPEQYFGLTQKD